jgi:hypothetical protein
MREVVKNEVLKLLKAIVIYTVSDSEWLSGAKEGWYDSC